MARFKNLGRNAFAFIIIVVVCVVWLPGASTAAVVKSRRNRILKGDPSLKHVQKREAKPTPGEAIVMSDKIDEKILKTLGESPMEQKPKEREKRNDYHEHHNQHEHAHDYHEHHENHDHHNHHENAAAEEHVLKAEADSIAAAEESSAAQTHAIAAAVESQEAEQAILENGEVFEEDDAGIMELEHHPAPHHAPFQPHISFPTDLMSHGHEPEIQAHVVDMERHDAAVADHSHESHAFDHGSHETGHESHEFDHGSHETGHGSHETDHGHESSDHGPSYWGGYGLHGVNNGHGHEEWNGVELGHWDGHVDEEADLGHEDSWHGSDQGHWAGHNGEETDHGHDDHGSVSEFEVPGHSSSSESDSSHGGRVNLNTGVEDVQTPLNKLLEQSTDLARETRLVFQVIAKREDYLVSEMEHFKQALQSAIEILQDTARENKARFKRWDNTNFEPYKACVYVTPQEMYQATGRNTYIPPSTEQLVQAPPALPVPSPPVVEEPPPVNAAPLIQEGGEDDIDLNSVYWLKLAKNEEESSLEKVHKVLGEVRQSGRDMLLIPVKKGFTSASDMANGFLRAVRVNPAFSASSDQKKRRRRLRLRIRRVL